MRGEVKRNSDRNNSVDFETTMNTSQIKSKERVRELAEVYTNEREVNAMLDLVESHLEPSEVLKYRYLEPSCGNGNFLIAILERKIRYVNQNFFDQKRYEFYLAKAVSTIYGIDICPENVNEARERLFFAVKGAFDLHLNSHIYSPGFLPLIRYILEKNIVQGDTINAPQKIYFTEFVARGYNFEQKVYNFSALIHCKNPKPVRVIPATYFLNIGLHHAQPELDFCETKS